MTTLTNARATGHRIETPTAADDSATRRGGLAGLGGAAALVAAFFTYPIFDLPSVDEVESLTNYSELATGRVVENSLYLAALVLWAVHFVAMGRTGRQTADGGTADSATPHGESTNGGPLLAPVVGVFGLVVMATGALIHISTSALSDLYIGAAGSAAEQAEIVLVWQALQAVFNTLLVTGVAIVPFAMVTLAWSLIKNGAVGRLSGGIALALGAAAAVGGAAGVIGGADSPGVPVAVLSMLVYHAIIGWRLVRS